MSKKTEINHLNFLYCFDSNYLNQAFSSIISLLDNIDELINIFVIYNQPIENLIIPKIVKEHKNLNNIKVATFKESGIHFPNLENNHISEATYYRLFIEKYVVNDVKFIFYLDADTICIKNISSLVRSLQNKLENSDCIIAAKTEKHLIDDNSDVFKRLNLNSKYFNAGVMGINLSKWKNENVTELLLEKLELLSDSIVFWDQDVLNSFFNGNYLELDEVLNYDSSNQNILGSGAAILHFIGSNKPWYLSGIFENASQYYHHNYSKFNKNKYHIVHIWKKSSLYDFVIAILKLKIFKLRFPFEFIKIFFKTIK